MGERQAKSIPSITTRRVDYEHELNPQQLEAVTAPPGPALVLAGAGTGKTRTLTYRVAYLLEQGVPPHQILLLTFTNKAANEMMQRVRQLIGTDLTALWGGTFHAIAHRILRRHAQRLGLDRQFIIIDREDSITLWKECLKEQEHDLRILGKGFSPKPEAIAEWISLARNCCTSIREIICRVFSGTDAEPLIYILEKLSAEYDSKKRRAQLVDFDDLLVFWLQLLEEHPTVASELRARFQHVLVDEYQDTNTLQARIVDLLVADHHQVMAVGDDAQSIYSWRGANLNNIVTFPERHPGTKIYRIQLNYRSTPEILRLANSIRLAGRRHFEKRLEAVRPSGPIPELVVCSSADAQARFIVSKVNELSRLGIGVDQIAVLYRSHFHAVELQMHLTQSGIPFTITSGIRFFEQAHIKDVAAILRWIYNPYDETALKRILSWFPGIGPRTAETIWQTNLQLLADIHFSSSADRAASLATHLATHLPAKAKAQWERFVYCLVKAPRLLVGPEPVSALLNVIISHFYEPYILGAYPNPAQRLEDLTQLTEYARGFSSLEEFLADLSLLASSEAEVTPASESEPAPRLRLLTVHQAKGLEWRVVFVIMLCEGMFPSAKASATREGLEEERRLFYVAVTRAKERLFLLYPLHRGIGTSRMLTSSRFIDELPEDIYERIYVS